MKGKLTRMVSTHKWVREFNAIHQGMIDKLMHDNPEEWTEVTKPSAGDRVYIYEVPKSAEDNHYGHVRGYNTESELYCVELDNGLLVSVTEGDFEAERDGQLPMWGTMWSFGNSVDDWWLEGGDGVQAMSACGFRIYKHEEFGYFFGIDGCGYDFYEAHWLPLYNRRGLQWHDPETGKEVKGEDLS